MIDLKAGQSKSSFIFVNFQFPSLTRMLKMKVNTKTTTLKSLRPILADKFGSDFAHIRLKFCTKNDKKQILDQQIPLYQLPYFGNVAEMYKIEVQIQYEGG